MVALSQWRQLFASHILQRGESYYEAGAVERLSRQGDRIQASVQGTQLYTVEVELHGELVAGWYCDCPYGEDGTPCKHLAAVFCALEDGGIPENTGEAPPPLAELVERLTPKQARVLLLKLAETDERIADHIRLAAGGAYADSLPLWERRMDQLLRRAAGRDGYIDYDQAWDTMCELDDLLTEAAGRMQEAGQLWEAFSLTGYALLAAARCDMDDSDGGLTMLADTCARLWQDQIAAAPPPIQERMYRWLRAAYDTSPMELYQEVILDTALSQFRAPELLRESLGWLDRLIQEVSQADQRHYGSLAWLVLRRLDIMEALDAPPEVLRRFEQTYWHLPEIRRRAVDRLLAAGQLAQAQSLLRTSKELDIRWPGLVRQYSRQLIGLYRQTGQEEALRQELTYQVFQYRQDDLDDIRQLKELTPPEQWPVLLEQLLSSQTVYGQREALLESEGQYERLLQAVVGAGRLEHLDRWAPVLKPRFPEVLRDAYLSCMDACMTQAGSRRQYAAVIAYLRTLADYPEGAQAARALARRWRCSYPRRRSMLDELDRAGYGADGRCR